VNQTSQSYQVTNSGSTTSFTYDANGNLTSDGTRTFTWDAEDRLISVTIGTHVSTLSYDGLSRRVEIVEADNGSTTSDTTFLWCGLALCEARDASTGTVLKRHFAEGVQDAGTAFFYTRDHLGTVRELTDSSNTVRARYDYDAGGRRTRISGDKDADIGYTNHYQHMPSGLLLAPFRAYDASLGRWLSEDPIGWAGGANRYAYVDGRPIVAVDPDGLQVTAALPFVPALVDAALDAAAAATVWTAATFEAWRTAQAIKAQQRKDDDQDFAHRQDFIKDQLRKRQEAKDELSRLERERDDAKQRNSRRRWQDQIDDLRDQIRGHERRLEKMGVCPL